MLEASDVEEDDEGSGEEAGFGRGVQGMDVGGDDGEEYDKDIVKPSAIDAYWLQRQVAAALGHTDPDAAEAPQMAGARLGERAGAAGAGRAGGGGGGRRRGARPGGERGGAGRFSDDAARGARAVAAGAALSRTVRRTTFWRLL